MLDPESNLVNKLQAPEPVDFTCLVPPRGDMSLLFVVLIIFIALVFHDTNGMHDAASSVSTKVFSPGQAVIWAAFFNFMTFLLFHNTVAETVDRGMGSRALHQAWVGGCGFPRFAGA